MSPHVPTKGKTGCPMDLVRRGRTAGPWKRRLNTGVDCVFHWQQATGTLPAWTLNAVLQPGSSPAHRFSLVERARSSFCSYSSDIPAYESKMMITAGSHLTSCLAHTPSFSHSIPAMWVSDTFAKIRLFVYLFFLTNCILFLDRPALCWKIPC